MTNVCLKRLQKELVAIKKSPVDNVIAVPNEANMLEWHYVILGPRDTPYEDGVYHGVLRFPTDYPYKPPSILMFTKNGRFKTHTRLCLSMSDYHPETWNPMWSVSSILSGLLSFMIDNQPTLGSIETSDEARRQLALNSMKENCSDPTFRKLFPELVQREKEGKSVASLFSSPSSSSSSSSKKNNNNPIDDVDESSGVKKRAGMEPPSRPLSADSGGGSPAPMTKTTTTTTTKGANNSSPKKDVDKSQRINEKDAVIKNRSKCSTSSSIAIVVAMVVVVVVVAVGAFFVLDEKTTSAMMARFRASLAPSKPSSSSQL